MISINHNLSASQVANTLSGHYGRLQTSTQRLSSGLRINSSADDAAGLAIRELMRADIAALNQGIRNANDAISMIQTFDGALGVIDEKLIRMKELAEQAATGTYSSDQRLMIDSEFQAMGSEINRIANATDFNGIKLLDGNFGTGRTQTVLTATATGVTTSIQSSPNGKTVDFVGTPSLSATNYSGYLPATAVGATNATETVTVNVDTLQTTATATETNAPNGPNFNYTINAIDRATYLPITADVRLSYVQNGATGSWQCTVDGVTLAQSDIGTTAGGDSFIEFRNTNYLVNLTAVSYNSQAIPEADLTNLNQAAYGKTTGLTLVKDSATYNRTYELDHPVVGLSSSMGAVSYNDATGIITVTPKTGDSVQLQYTNGTMAQGDRISFNLNISGDVAERTVPIRDEDSRVKIHFGSGNDSAEDYYYINKFDATLKGLGLEDVDIQTQGKAQDALVQINDAIVEKDKIRAEYGAMQNRLENTISNLTIQSENLQAAESRISDADIATEMMQFVKNQILTQSAVAMLAQANSMPQMVMALISR